MTGIEPVSVDRGAYPTQWRGEFFVGLFAAGDQVRMYWIMAALCSVVVIAAIVFSRDRWRRMPAVRDNDDALTGAAISGGQRDRE